MDEVRSAVTSRLGASALIALAFVAACDRPAVSHDDGAVSSSVSRPPGYVVDSALPREELLRRFRVGLEPTSQLAGAGSRDELVRRYLRAVKAKDASAMRRLVIDRAEFAYLVFPESRVSKPPYRQPPEIAWLLLESGTNAAITKLLQRADGLELLGYHCSRAPEIEGAIRVTSDCAMTVRENGRERDVRLFGRIIERDGRFKFAGLAGDL